MPEVHAFCALEQVWRDAQVRRKALAYQSQQSELAVLALKRFRGVNRQSNQRLRLIPLELCGSRFRWVFWLRLFQIKKKGLP